MRLCFIESADGIMLLEESNTRCISGCCWAMGVVSGAGGMAVVPAGEGVASVMVLSITSR